MASAHAGDWIYIAQKGDNFWNLCLEYTNKKGCWIELGKYNHIINDRALPPLTRLRIPLAWLKTLPTVATATSVSGEAWYKAYDSSQMLTLSKNQALTLGTTITTQEGSATLSFDGGHTLLVRKNSQLVLSSFNNGKPSIAEIELETGNVEAKVIKSSARKPATIFQIKTPSAIAAVRGTEFRVSSGNTDAKLMRGEVTTGSIAVSAANKIQNVVTGFGVSAKKGQRPSEPKKLLNGPLIIGDPKRLKNPAFLSWQPVSGAKAYQLDVWDNNQLMVLSQTLFESKINLPAFDTSCYTANLRAIDLENFQGLDTKFDLCLLEPLAIPKLVTKTINSTTQLITWQSITGADSYVVEFSTSPDFHPLSSTHTTTATELSITKNDEPSYVRVIAINSQRGQSSPPCKAGCRLYFLN